MRLTVRSMFIRSACTLALALGGIAAADRSQADIALSITLAPPALPFYEQPVLDQEGGIWAPGYWYYDNDAYFWLPGAWVQPPAPGLLWTPGYWVWGEGGYAWNAGYWGATVGFYGGINYGFGYFGHGYEGGHWRGRQFFYNTAVSHVNVTNIRNTYARTVVNETAVNRVSFNGGNGGVSARANGAELAAAHAPHRPATAAQARYREAAIVHRSGPAAAPVHAIDLPRVAHEPVSRTGDAERDNQNQREQDALRDQQEQQRRELQQSQANDHARAAMQALAPMQSHAAMGSQGAMGSQEAMQSRAAMHTQGETQSQSAMRSQAEMPSQMNGGGEALEREHQAQTHAMMQRHSAEQDTLRQTQQNRPQTGREEPHR
jgi:hypothetical protein